MADRSITLDDNDWNVVRAAMYELPIKIGLATLQRLETALAAPVKAPEPAPIIPRLVEAE